MGTRPQDVRELAVKAASEALRNGDSLDDAALAAERVLASPAEEPPEVID